MGRCRGRSNRYEDPLLLTFQRFKKRLHTSGNNQTVGGSHAMRLLANGLGAAWHPDVADASAERRTDLYPTGPVTHLLAFSSEDGRGNECTDKNYLHLYVLHWISPNQQVTATQRRFLPHEAGLLENLLVAQPSATVLVLHLKGRSRDIDANGHPPRLRPSMENQ
jgi:hypothetical protein